MTLPTLLIYIGIAAIIITVLVSLVFKKHKSWLMTFLQNYCGVLFIVSGWVKAVDPLGTAYKMEQYFAEFETLFDGTWFSFLSPMFPWLSEYAIGFSVFMIVLEIVMGLMLILGVRGKLTSWAFLLLVGFFTFLTGFTYLTGYVGAEASFWQFGEWGAHNKANMKVQDCGCFGDFIKLEPKTSFLKDIFLLIPAFFFVFKHKDMHQLFSPAIRSVMTLVTAVGILLYCLSNFAWDIPGQDFRPFKEGVNVREQKRLEMEAQSNVHITEWVLTNKSSGEVVSMSNADYMGGKYKEYPKADWDIDNKLSEPTMERTKISDFALEDENLDDQAEALLMEPGYVMMIIIPKLKSQESYEKQTVNRTEYRVDTIAAADGSDYSLQRDTVEITEEVDVVSYSYDQDLIRAFVDHVNPITEAAQKSGMLVVGAAGAATQEALSSLKQQADLDYDFLTADDIMLKTIIRSTPGVLLMKDGIILKKWHYKKLPSAEKFASSYPNK